MSATTAAFREATIFTIDTLMFRNLDVIEQVRSGKSSFVTHLFLPISSSISFMSGSYGEPPRLVRKGTILNGETMLLTTMVKD